MGFEEIEKPGWVEKAVDNGHDIFPDPPGVSRAVIRRSALSEKGREVLSATPRWTCRRCGYAVLKGGGGLFGYGRAVDHSCHLSDDEAQ